MLLADTGKMLKEIFIRKSEGYILSLMETIDLCQVWHFNFASNCRKNKVYEDKTVNRIEFT